MKTLALLVSSMLGAACATPGSPADAPASGEFVDKGGFEYRGTSANFSDDRITGPQVEISRRADGSWGGRAGGQIVDVSVRFGALRGASTIISWEEKADGVVIDGQFYNRVMHFEVTNSAVTVRTGAGVNQNGTPRTFSLPRVDREHFAGGFSIHGQATEIHPPEPQFALALIGAFFDPDSSIGPVGEPYQRN